MSFVPSVATVVRKVNSDSTEAWHFASNVVATMKGFEIDPSETNVYFAVSTNPLYLQVFAKLNTVKPFV